MLRVCRFGGVPAAGASQNDGDAAAVVVSVVEGNEVALKLYERFGFGVVSRDKYGHIVLGQELWGD